MTLERHDFHLDHQLGHSLAVDEDAVTVVTSFMRRQADSSPESVDASQGSFLTSGRIPG